MIILRCSRLPNITNPPPKKLTALLFFFFFYPHFPIYFQKFVRRFHAAIFPPQNHRQLAKCRSPARRSVIKILPSIGDAKSSKRVVGLSVRGVGSGLGVVFSYVGLDFRRICIRHVPGHPRGRNRDCKNFRRRRLRRDYSRVAHVLVSGSDANALNKVLSINLRHSCVAPSLSTPNPGPRPARPKGLNSIAADRRNGVYSIQYRTKLAHDERLSVNFRYIYRIPIKGCKIRIIRPHGRRLGPLPRPHFKRVTC